MNEVKTFVDRISESEDLFLFFGDRTYTIQPGSRSNDYAQFPGYAVSLVPSLPFYSLERFDSSINAAAINAECRSFLKTTIDQELKAEQDINREKSRIKALEFIVFDFLPLLYSKKYDDDGRVAEMFEAGETTGDAVGIITRAKKELQEKLDLDFAKELAVDDPSERIRLAAIEREKRKIKTNVFDDIRYSPEELGIDPKAITPSTTGAFTACQPFYVDCKNGRVYCLDKVQAADTNGLVFKINGNQFIPKFSGLKLSDFRNELRERILQNARVSALELNKADFKIIGETVKAKGKMQSQMLQLARLNEYDLGNCGFVLQEGTYYVYSRIPKFATQDGRDGSKFWPFPSVRVAIDISYDNYSGRIISGGDPIVIEPMAFHPCLGNKTKGFCKICNLESHANDYRQDGRGMLRKLSDGVNVITHPLNKRSLDRHPGEAYFGVTLNEVLQQGSLTREEALSQGYFVAEVLETAIEFDKTAEEALTKTAEAGEKNVN